MGQPPTINSRQSPQTVSFSQSARFVLLNGRNVRVAGKDAGFNEKRRNDKIINKKKSWISLLLLKVFASVCLWNVIRKSSLLLNKSPLVGVFD